MLLYNVLYNIYVYYVGKHTQPAAVKPNQMQAKMIARRPYVVLSERLDHCMLLWR